MQFSLWLEKRNQKSAGKMPKKKSDLELHQRAVKKAIQGMQHGRAGSHDLKKDKGSRQEKNRKAIEDNS